MISPFPTDDELAWFREQAEAGMVDVCVITREGVGEPVFNETTGQYTDPARVDIYGPGIAPHFGKCRFQDAGIANAAAAVVNAGDRATNVQGGELQLPVEGTGVVAVNDVAELISSATDSSRVGHKYTIATRFEKTHASSRRLRLSEATG